MVSGKICVLNDTPVLRALRRNEHFCQVHATTELDLTVPCVQVPVITRNCTTVSQHSEAVKIDPDSMMPESYRTKFHNLVKTFDEVFSPELPGYNVTFGKFEATINIGPVQPPQRKGRVPQYSRNNLEELQQKFDELEKQGVFCTPDKKNVTAEYLNPSFLVKKT